MDSGSILEVKDNRSVRLKVTDKCPLSCCFCHAEGGSIEDIQWNDEFAESLCKLNEKLDLKEVHLTGGEPTFNKELAEISSGIFSIGLDVKVTTNGQFNHNVIDQLRKAGVFEFNFSIHALNNLDLIKIMPNVDKKSASNIIDKQRKNLLYAKKKELRLRLIL